MRTLFDISEDAVVRKHFNKDFVDIEEILDKLEEYYEEREQALEDIEELQQDIEENYVRKPIDIGVYEHDFI